MPNVIREPKSALRARQREIVKTLSRHGLAFLVDRVHVVAGYPGHPRRCGQRALARGLTDDAARS